MITNTYLVEYAKKCLNNSCYIYGTYGQLVTEKLIDSKAKQYPKQMTADRVIKAKKIHIGKHAWDCSGIIKGAIMGNTYNATQDRNAAGMYHNCATTGKIVDIPEVVGLLVFNKTLSHVGVYIGNGKVIEAKGFSYGIRKTNISNFYYYGFYNEINYITDIPAKTTSNTYKATITAVSGLNIRTGASIMYKKLDYYKYGEIVEILEEVGEWGRTNKGFINLKWVRRI